MSEIDVSKCKHIWISNNKKECLAYQDFCVNRPDCYYKQLQQTIKDRDYYKQIVDGCKSENGNCSFCEIDKQLQQLKQENESYEYQLEKRIEICDSWMNLSNKYKQCLYECLSLIEKEVNPYDTLLIIKNNIKEVLNYE